MRYHLIAFLIGFFMDQVIGDPAGMPHPIRAIGSLILFLEGKLMGDASGGAKTEPAEESEDLADGGKTVLSEEAVHKQQFKKGILLCVAVLMCTAAVTAVIVLAAYRLHPFFGVAVEAVLTCYILAVKSLQTESMKVYDALKEGDVEKARAAVSMIVGRDTERLDEQGIIRAAVETVAENASDGAIAPLLYTFLGGPVAGFAYKAVNTMDSMVGYRNERYEFFGKAAAKLDDLVNFLPARISAVLMILSAFLLGKDYSGKDAMRIFLRDRYNHKSPNSAQTESACAGALRVRLAGDAYYFGKLVKKPFIGDDLRPVEAEDIKRACRLMRTSVYLCVVVLCVIAVFFL